MDVISPFFSLLHSWIQLFPVFTAAYVLAFMLASLANINKIPDGRLMDYISLS